MIIAVDFDGVLLDRSTREPIPGAYSALRKLSHKHGLMIHTCRREGDPVLDQAVRNVLAHKTPLSIWRGEGKPEADIYLDDHALRFTGDWAQTMREIKALGG